MAYLGSIVRGSAGGFQPTTRYDPVLAELFREAIVGPASFHEMAAMVRYAESRGLGAIRFRFDDEAGLTSPAHPLHVAFLATLRDPVLASDFADLGEIAPWRERALAVRLPSDMLGARPSRTAMRGAITAIGSSCEVRVALCVAARVRFGGEAEWFGREAQALYEMGLFPQARARLAASVSGGGEAIAIG
ncbi:hypothetical protein [Sphingomonas pokkalii]|uniref:Uncharacterized protein n=1 Tax=Sphingomonas pokkalii TaxID=2175090 RepID=A0A2U0SCF5_9SPHN|nr:hypothetical protein [Sphingomonas pokkalii]PVX28971.1 hypothetical protein DD559_06170 [Sphingomonas pokkalii]